LRTVEKTKVQKKQQKPTKTAETDSIFENVWQMNALV